MRILISAGEASGEMYGAQLMAELRQVLSGTQSSQSSPIQFFGVGGERMRAAGCEIVVDARDLAVVGITEILSHLGKIWHLFQKLIHRADETPPDLAIVIDSPAFNWRAARQMKKRGVPVVYYVCPQFWAWRQGRVRLLRKYVDKALVIFPFEEQFYRDRGVNAEFVGHPLAELPLPDVSRQQYAQQHALGLEKQWITLMPGSRVKEVRMNLPGMVESSKLLGDGYEFVLPVAPTLDRNFIADMLSSLGAPSSSIHLVPDALSALAHSRAGIIASGTATVEAAMMNTPFVMVYRVTPLTHLLGRWTVKVPFFAMVNLIAGKKIVPELVQQDFTPAKVVSELNRITPDGDARQQMSMGLDEVRALLRGKASGMHPSKRAALAIAAFLQPATPPRQL